MYRSAFSQIGALREFEEGNAIDYIASEEIRACVWVVWGPMIGNFRSGIY
jgi:hypothetical protein